MHCGHPGRSLHPEGRGWTRSYSVHREELKREGERGVGQAAASRPGPHGGLDALRGPCGTSSKKICFYHIESILPYLKNNHDHLLYMHFFGV